PRKEPEEGHVRLGPGPGRGHRECAGRPRLGDLAELRKPAFRVRSPRREPIRPAARSTWRESEREDANCGRARGGRARGKRRKPVFAVCEFVSTIAVSFQLSALSQTALTENSLPKAER